MPTMGWPSPPSLSLPLPLSLRVTLSLLLLLLLVATSSSYVISNSGQNIPSYVTDANNVNSLYALQDATHADRRTSYAFNDLDVVRNSANAILYRRYLQIKNGEVSDDKHEELISKSEIPEWRSRGLESASLTFVSHNSRGRREYYHNIGSTTCPRNCVCGVVTGVTCYSLSPDALLPLTFPPGMKILTIYGYKNIRNELQSLSELHELRIYDGKTTGLPNLPRSLNVLHIINSNLEHLDNLHKLRRLHALNVAYNNITSADLLPLSQLVTLDMSHNPLEKVPALAQSLTILNLRNTYLNKQQTEWNVDLPNLIKLDLGGILMFQPPYLVFPKLKYLDLSHSTIKLTPYFSGLPSLKEINLSHLKLYQVVPDNFKGPSNLEVVDLSFTNITKLPDKIFINNPKLRELYLHNTNLQSVQDYTFSGQHKLEKLIINDNPELKNLDDLSLSTIKGLKLLDMSNTNINALPLSIRNISLEQLNSINVSLLCDCHAHWLPDYLSSIVNSTHFSGLLPIRCTDGVIRSIQELRQHLLSLHCMKPDIISPPDFSLIRDEGKTVLLECNATGNPPPLIIWYSPEKKYYTYKHPDIQPWFSDNFKLMLQSIVDEQSKLNTRTRTYGASTVQVLKTGQLLIQNMTSQDIGYYRCTAVNAIASVKSSTALWMTTEELEAIQFETLLFGVACGMTFFLTTLIVQLITYIMERMGWECCCCRGRISSRALRVKRLLESVESYKSQQLERLKENYNSQVVNIKESCYQQMERLSESYSTQCKNLQSIKDYSAQQLTTSRDQYLEQITKVRDYSVGQMNKVSENYVFQRQRIRKFSAHQLFKLRETYKYQQKTLNKILENIPDLYLQNCRTGNCQRTDSMIFDDQIHGIDAYYRLDFLNFNNILCSEGGSEEFYTPSSTLNQAQRQFVIEHHKRQHSAGSTSTATCEYHEAAQSWTTNTPNTSPKLSPSHFDKQLCDKLSPFHMTDSLRRKSAVSLKSNTGTNMHKRSSSSSTVDPTTKAPTTYHRRALSANINTNQLVKIHNKSVPLEQKMKWNSTMENYTPVPIQHNPKIDDEHAINVNDLHIKLSSVVENANDTQCVQTNDNSSLIKSLKETQNRCGKEKPEINQSEDDAKQSLVKFENVIRDLNTSHVSPTRQRDVSDVIKEQKVIPFSKVTGNIEIDGTHNVKCEEDKKKGSNEHTTSQDEINNSHPNPQDETSSSSSSDTITEDKIARNDTNIECDQAKDEMVDLNTRLGKSVRKDSNIEYEQTHVEVVDPNTSTRRGDRSPSLSRQGSSDKEELVRLLPLVVEVKEPIQQSSEGV